MFPGWLQAALFFALTGYLLHEWRYLFQRNRQNWESLASRLRWASNDGSKQDRGIEDSITAEGIRLVVLDLRNSKNRFQNAGIVLEMADFIERNASSESAAAHRELLQELRRDAMQIRLDAVFSFPRVAFGD